VPASTWRTWAELAPSEQGAATRLGFAESTWDAAQLRTPAGEVELFWSAFAWEELRRGEQQLFALLGWNEESWAGDLPIPESEYRRWEELSEVEQGAASQLGFDPAGWDATVLEH
jgi:hypothetical protein